MSRVSSDDPDRRVAKGRLTLVVSAESDEVETAPQAGDREREGAAVLARKALYRQTGLIEVVIDNGRKRKVISDALGTWGVKPAGLRSRKGLVAVSVIVVLMVLSVFPLYLVSRTSLPGDPLWRLKRGGEGVKQWLARGAPAEAEAALAATGERLEETARLADHERFDAAREALARFYDEFDGARRRLRAVPRETHPEIYREADRQLTEAAALDQRLNGEAVRGTAPRGPEAVGTLSPTPRPPWEPENPKEAPG